MCFCFHSIGIGEFCGKQLPEGPRETSDVKSGNSGTGLGDLNRMLDLSWDTTDGRL